MKRSGNVRLLLSASLLAGAAVSAAVMTSCSRPAAPAVADDGFDPNRTYVNNTYYPRLGYYHAGAHWFFPHPVNYFMPGQGYYYGGSWYPIAQALIMLSQPDSSRAYAYLSEHRRRDDGWGYGGSSGGGYRGGGYYGGGGGFAGGSGYSGNGRGFAGSAGEAGVSRGGFGAAGHAAGAHGGGE